MDSFVPVILMAAIVLVIAAMGVKYWQRISSMKRWNYDWYRSEFPHLVNNGRVSCYKCKGSNVGTERLMNQTFIRSHICRHCGTTLYYSREQ